MRYYEDNQGDRFLVDECTYLFAANQDGAGHADEPRAAITGEDIVIDLDHADEIKVYTIDPYQWDEDDIDGAEEALAGMFWSMIRDTSDNPDQAVADMLADGPMMRETFNNWTDMLNKDGQLCDDAYQDLAPDLEKYL